QLNMVDPLVEAQMLGNRVVARILQNGFAPADQDWYFSRIHLEPIEQTSDVGIMIEIEILERVVVAREEGPDTERRGGVRGADEQRVTNALRAELDPSVD